MEGVGAQEARAPVRTRPLTPPLSPLGKFVELLSVAYRLHIGINVSRICSQLWPRASRDAVNCNSPSSASRVIARTFCPTVRDSKIIKEPRVMMEQGRCPQTTSPALATV